LNVAKGRLTNLSVKGENPGALRAKQFVPENLGRNAALVVVLHGCTQTADTYDHGSGWSQLAEREGFAVLYPEQQRANNPNLCFNWFEPADTQRGRGEAHSIKEMIEAMVDHHAIDRQRIYITGLSAGGAMTSVMLATYPEVFAGGAIIAGLAYGIARSVPEAFDRMRGHGRYTERELQELLSGASPQQSHTPTISVWHGLNDRTVVPSNAEDIVAQWRGPHRVSPSPTRSDLVSGHSRRVWCDAAGNTVIEEYRIAGLGHGTPICVNGPDAAGTAGPFMLEAGISSTKEIARSWGLLHAVDSVRSHSLNASASAKPMESKKIPSRHGDPPANGKSGSQSQVGSVIENALRAAGLMR
jgi:poly(hydroxyalkanoate) depolymerase family esterase